VPSPQFTATARCLRCPWKAEGDPAAIDKAGEKHTAADHPTAVVTTPAPAKTPAGGEPEASSALSAGQQRQKTGEAPQGAQAAGRGKFPVNRQAARYKPGMARRMPPPARGGAA